MKPVTWYARFASDDGHLLAEGDVELEQEKGTEVVVFASLDRDAVEWDKAAQTFVPAQPVLDVEAALDAVQARPQDVTPAQSVDMVNAVTDFITTMRATGVLSDSDVLKILTGVTNG